MLEIGKAPIKQQKSFSIYYVSIVCGIICWLNLSWRTWPHVST